MPSVGYATLQVIPSVRGIEAELRRQLVGPSIAAGGQAGQAAGEGLRNKVKAGAALAGAAAGALLVKGITDAIDQANVTSTLQAQLGTSNKVAADQGKLAGKLYGSGVANSFQEAADAIKATVQAGLAPPGTTNAQLQQIATKASDVANVFGQDLGGVTNAVSQLMRTGLAKNSGQAFDLITRGFQSGANKADDLLDVLNEYSTQFAKMGLSGAQAVGVINQAIRGGARDADVVADAFKEFSLRAVDGTDKTAAAFKTLGIDATSFVAEFSKGGASSQKALDLVFDRLRTLKGAQWQNVVADLFGGPGEDLGQAINAIDVSRATTQLGALKGATDQVGKTLRSGPTHEIQVFVRGLQQGLVNIVGGQVLPILGQVARWFSTNLLPPIRAVATVVAAILIPALTGLWTAGTAVVGWLQSMGTWLIPIGIAVTGLTVAITAQRIAVALTTAVFSVYRGAILAWAAVQRGATIVQAAFNAVMSANPVILVITAILALGAAIVVAYQRVGWFRTAVQAAWLGIQTAASWAWNNVLLPVFNAFRAGLSAIGAAATWLWTTVLSPVFSFIGTAARILATIIGVIVVGPIIIAIRALGAIFSWLWTNIISPVVGWIGARVSWLNTNIIQPNIALIRGAISALGSAFSWLWQSVVQPVLGWIASRAIWLWTYGIQPSFGLLRGGLAAVGSAFSWLWRSVVQPVFGWIGDRIGWVWRTLIKPAFDLIGRGVSAVGRSFEDAKNFIGRAWSQVQDIAKKPVRFIIGTVYNRGIVPTWNLIADAFGAPKIKAMDIRGWARGGPVFGAGTETSDDVPAWLSRNEHVWTAKEVRGAGGHGAVAALRSWAASGGGRKGTPAFKDGGGLFGWIGSAASALKGVGSSVWSGIKKAASWLADTLEASARAGVKHVVDPLLARMPGADTGFGKMIRRLPTKALDAIFGYSKKADEKGAGGVGTIGGVIPSGSRRAIISQALAAAHVPPPGTMSQWLAGMNTLISRESGWNPRARNNWDINAKNGIPSQGLAQTIPPTWSAYVPNSLRSRGILDPVSNVAAAIRYIVARYGNITRVQQANANRPPAGYDSGGWLMPGYTAAYNGTGQPEAVLTSQQWSAMSAAAARSEEPVIVEVHARDDALADFIDVRVHRGQQQLTSVLRAGRR
ncbi:phage tail tape measure protein [Streptomyces rimosus]|uniref:phage tail tape measure protein n=1 Tax=Streptomyces rimosus TaxID=1927 RepID=UPI00099CEDD2|nr:phage tail tape measure protein [Streptomyces rimosus]